MTETEAIITRLAKLPCPCPKEALCEGCYMDQLEAKGEEATWPREKHTPYCTCKGIGVRFHWLWEKCSECGEQGTVSPNLAFPETCGFCSGKGWITRVDISLEEAIAELTGENSLTVLKEWYDHLPLAVGTTAEDIRLAFWQAVEKAVNHE